MDDELEWEQLELPFDEDAFFEELETSLYDEAKGPRDMTRRDFMQPALRGA